RRHIHRRVRGDSSECYPFVAERGPSGGSATGKVDGPTGILDHYRVKTVSGGVFRRIADAIVESEADTDDTLDAALPPIAQEARRSFVVILEKGRIGVDLRTKTLADDEFDAGNVESLVEARAFRLPDAMIGPKCLRAVGHRDLGKGRFARMARCERRVALRVPILGQDDMAEIAGEAVYDRYHLIAARNGEAAARAEIILQIEH